MGIQIERIELLLLAAAIVAMLARRFHFPYTVGLVATGLIMAMLPMTAPLVMTKELIFNVLLPPLIFEAALFLPWHSLRRELAVVCSMASFGVLLAALVVATGMHYGADWPWLPAWIFGALISATDPVSVIATFKESGVHGRLRILVEAESLFNDGTAAVLFGILLVLGQGASVTGWDISSSVLLTVGGGIGCGLLVAGGVLYLAGKTSDHLLELTFTTVAAFGSFLLAEHFYWSGVLATLAAGLLIGNHGPHGAISPKGHETVQSFWEYLAFVADSLIFLLIGLHEAQQNFIKTWPLALLAIALVTLGRVLAVYPVALLFSRSRFRISMPHQHIMFWGGLRGALSLALALGLPPDLPLREAIVSAAFAVVAFSVVVQGMSVGPLLRYFGEIKPGSGGQINPPGQDE
jgi:CPA1 family monovalent cation:H+ antiporter